MERLADFLLHLDTILRVVPVNIFQGVQTDFPIQLDSSTTELDLDAVTAAFATSAKELDCYLASLAELPETKLQKLQQKYQEAETKLRELNRLLEDALLKLKKADTILSKVLENRAYSS